MFDTMTGTKIVGGLCGTFLVFLLGNLVAEGLYHVGAPVHDGEVSQAYTVAVEGNGAAGPAAAETVDVAAVLAAGDAAKGEKLFGKCKGCHTVEGRNGTGPHLDGVVGRAVASVEGFPYSSALRDFGGNWEPERLYAFIHAPQKDVPGTKMTFPGFKKPQDTADVIAFLKSKS